MNYLIQSTYKTSLNYNYSENVYDWNYESD